ncbi:hypothetical protein [Romboutsia sp.]|uniref:hypothetical protein n=1 Tax=Romboutsia sp. TaxID=1965302 RepID=UPI002D1192BB|nr:hypothetical protein [Romboutsia sp.]HSQ89780.1 hypothetical protein [Romboutsia sp.]
MVICNNKKFILEKEDDNKYVVYRVKGKRKTQRVQIINGTEDEVIEIFNKWY